MKQIRFFLFLSLFVQGVSQLYAGTDDSGKIYQWKVSNAVFAHGFGPKNEHQVQYQRKIYENFDFVPGNSFYSSNDQSRILCFSEIRNKNMRQSAFGQGEDVQILKDHCNESNKKDGGYFIYGLSRGGGATLNFLAQNEHQENLKAVVLESPLLDMNSVLPVKVIQTVVGFGLPKWLVHAAVSLFIKGRYPLVPQSGLDCVAKIKNKDLPILIVHDENDQLIACSSSVLLYEAFQGAGFKNVDFIITKSLGHCGALWDQSGTRVDQAQTVDRFFLKHGLKSSTDQFAYIGLERAQITSEYDVDDLHAKYMKLTKIQTLRNMTLFPQILFYGSLAGFMSKRLGYGFNKGGIFMAAYMLAKHMWQYNRYV